MPVIAATIKQTQEQIGWPTSKILCALGVARSNYYRWLRQQGRPHEAKLQPFEVLPEERMKVVVYARAHPELRHRELAWRAIDEDVVCLSASTIYRILKEEGLVDEWKKRTKNFLEIYKATRPDEKWQTDITYIKILERFYYLIVFIDEYSRYITSWELMPSMDRHAVSLAAEDAVSSLPEGVCPIIQTDGGSGFISRDFKIVLSKHGIAHQRIRPHTPEDNGIVERVHGTMKRALEDYELDNVELARSTIKNLVHWYNECRYHSSLSYLPPVVYYRGDPEPILKARQEKIALARHRRKEMNIKRRQQTLYLSPTMEEQWKARALENQNLDLSHSG